jgi:hypothetical protein
MSQKIVHLMEAPNRDLGWLQDALQSAVELEMATLPPYLCGYWALPDAKGYPAKQIRNIVMQEMAHLGFACNMLCAVGKKPEILIGYGNIQYPGPLPGGVVPKKDSDLIPWDPKFQVQLGFDDFKAFALMCARIEYPEDPVPKALFRAGQIFPSIGQFYDAILDAFHLNDGKIPYATVNQQEGLLGLYMIDKLDKAVAAIQEIQREGEGGSKNPYSGPNQLSHFYAFGELYYRKNYVFNAATGKGDWSGTDIPLQDDQISDMTPIPTGGYPSPPAEVLAFDQTFTEMLGHLDAAWSGGGGAELNAATDMMPDLTDQATSLLGKKKKRTDGPGIYGPQFRMVKTSLSTGGGSSNTGAGTAPVSFARDIKPLFRAIDVAHMKPMGVVLDDYAYMSDVAGDHANAKAVLDVLKNKRMPPGGPFWTPDQLNLFAKWMSDGYKA